MVVIVPQDVRSFVSTLDADKWDAVISSLVPTKVDAVAIPKFALSFDAFLNDALKAMGMDVAVFGWSARALPPEAELRQVVAMLAAGEPVLLHCASGSDRTVSIRADMREGRYAAARASPESTTATTTKVDGSVLLIPYS